MKPLNVHFYTGDYGYGHAARNIALIRRLRRDLGAEVCKGVCMDDIDALLSMKENYRDGMLKMNGADDCIRRLV